MTDIQIVFAIIAVIIVLFIWDRLPVIAVCMAAALSLWATGILTLGQSLAGFGDPATVFVASLFVVSAGLDRTGVTAWAGQFLVQLAGENRSRLTIFMILLVGVLSALISLNGAVAALLPVIVVLAVRLGRPPSELLMPLVFGAHAGSMLALTGSPVNVLVMEASLEAGGPGFSYFEFALVGIPLIGGVIVLALVLGPFLLPKRESKMLPPDLSGLARTLMEQFRLSEGTQDFVIRAESPVVGLSGRDIDFSDRSGLALVTLRRASGAPVGGGAVAVGDILVLRGDPERMAEAAEELVLAPREDAGNSDLADALLNRESGLAEVVIPPRSPLVGQRFFPGMVTESGDLVVLGIQRAGEEVPAGEPLAVGDTMLLQGAWGALESRLDPAEAMVVNAPDLVRRQAVPMGAGAKQMIIILVAMVVLLATGIVPGAVAGLLAAGAVLITGLLSVEQLYRSINWTTVILVGAMMPLSTAISQTGAAQMLADGLITMVGDAGPRLMVAGLFVLTAVLGQLVSNTATALIIIPIAVVAAGQMNVAPEPVLMGVCIAAAAAFLTPVATPTNLMVMEPAGYRFGDYWKFGAPMMLWFFVVAVWLVPLIWPF